MPAAGKSLEEIKAYWQDAARAETDADGLRPTARDPFLQEAVESVVERYVPRSGRLLDVGCGDGTSTLRFARSVREAVGIDYIDAFVSRAINAAARQAIHNVHFRQASVLDLSELRRKGSLFDIAVSIRCLINLPEATQQAKGVAEIAACLRPGGRYLASEGWQEGMQGLNRLRAAAGLPAIETVAYNLLLPRAEFEAEAAKHFEIEAYHSLGFYLFMSRVVQPLVVAPEAPRHDHRINQVAAQLSRVLDRSEFRDCDYAGVYVLRHV